MTTKTPMTETQMTERLKEMKRAYVIIKILEGVATFGCCAGFIGIMIIGSVDMDLTPDSSFGAIMIAAGICCAILAGAAWLLNKIEGLPEQLHKRICKLQRTIRETRIRQRIEAERKQQNILPIQRIG